MSYISNPPLDWPQQLSLQGYRCIDIIGTGTTSEVYLATNSSGNHVAIKVLRKEHRSAKNYYNRFSREANVTRRLHHPYVVTVETYSLGDAPFIIMEYAPHRDLSFVLRREALDVIEAAFFAMQLADGLAYVHSREILHRDIKPANILIFDEIQKLPQLKRRAKIGDFGLANDLRSGRLTQLQQIVGTPHYMAPEQHRGSGVSKQTDIYALGLVMYEMFVRQRPFAGESRNIATRHLQDKPTPMRHIKPDIDVRIEQITMRCLEKEQADRYGSAAELVNDLSEWLSQANANIGALGAPRGTDLFFIPDYKPVPQPDFMLADDNLVATVDRMEVRQGPEGRLVAPPALIRKPELTIGRFIASDICLDAQHVSREHAIVHQTDDGTYTITDLNTANGTRLDGVRLEPNMPTEWRYGQIVEISSYRLRLIIHDLDNGDDERDELNRLGPGMVNQRAAYLLAQISNNPFIVMPGVGGNLHVKLEYMDIDGVPGPKTDRLRLYVRGLPNGWVTTPEESIMLERGAEKNTTIHFNPPISPQSLAGRHIFTLRAFSEVQQFEVLRISAVVQVDCFTDIHMELHPHRVTHRGQVTVFLTNNSNHATDVRLLPDQSVDEDYFVDVITPEVPLHMPPGAHMQTTISVRPRASIRLLGARIVPFGIMARSNDTTSHAQGELLIVTNRLHPQFFVEPDAVIDPTQIFPVAPVAPTYNGMVNGQKPSVIEAWDEPENPVPPLRPLDPRERSMELGIWLAICTGVGLLVFALTVAGTGVYLVLVEPRETFVILLVYMWIFTGVYALTIIQTWNWRRWAFYLLLLATFFIPPIGPLLTLSGWIAARNDFDWFE